MTISIRDVTIDDAETLAHILVTANDKAFRGLVPDRIVDFTEEESANNWKNFFDDGIHESNVFIMAFNSEEKGVGYAWGAPNSRDNEPYDGELCQLMILPAYQGQGIGRLLVEHVAQRLAQKGLHSMRVEVLKINPNRGFYPHLGGTLFSEFPYDWDGFMTTACAYGWDDTRLISE